MCFSKGVAFVLAPSVLPTVCQTLKSLQGHHFIEFYFVLAHAGSWPIGEFANDVVESGIEWRDQHNV